MKYWKEHEEDIKRVYDHMREQQMKELGPMSLSRVFGDLVSSGDQKKSQQGAQLQEKELKQPDSSGSTIVPITGK